MANTVTHENGLYRFDGFELTEAQAVAVLARYHAAGQYRWTQRECCDWLWTAHHVSVSRPQLAAAFRVLGVTKNCVPILPHQQASSETIRANLVAEADAAHRDTATQYWRTRAELAERRYQSVTDEIQRQLASIPGHVVCEIAPVPPRDDDATPYTAVLLWSDWHVGQNTDACARKVQDLIQQTIDHFRTDRRPVDGVLIGVLGDLLDGAGEADTSYSGQTAAQDVHGVSQIERTARLLASAVEAISTALPRVPIHVAAVAGNHGRTHGRRNADHERICEWAAYRLASEWTTQAEWVISTGEALCVDVGDTRVVLTHGDRASKNLRDLRWGYDSPDARWYLVACGHYHAARASYSEDGRCVAVTNGALAESGDHGRAHGWHAPGAQALIEITQRGPALSRIFRISDK